MRLHRILLSVTAATAILAISAHGGVRYTVISIGQGRDWSALGINASGQITGQGTLEGSTRAFRWTDGTITNLGIWPEYEISVGRRINASGHVAGCAFTSDVFAPPLTRALRWIGSTMSDIGTPNSLSGADATDINDSGQIVGWAWWGDSRPFLYDGAGLIDLGTMRQDNFGGGTAAAINNLGQVVGRASRDGIPDSGAFLYSGGSMSYIGALYEGEDTSAKDINDSGKIVGDSSLPFGSVHAFFYDGAMHDMGTLGGGRIFTRAINNFDQVVGRANTAIASNDYRGYLWQNGTMVDLNDLIDQTSGWKIVGADDINDSGQIAATAFLGSSQFAVLLNPIPPDADGDGVPDAQDACAQTVPGAAVDATGCPAMIRFDFDHDGDVDFSDLEVFNGCGSGPAILHAGGDDCLRCDPDSDGDVDGDDFGSFQHCYSGEGHPADSSGSCALASLCPGGLTYCGGCVNLMFDTQNCGACGNVCSTLETCSGTCVPAEPCPGCGG